MMKLSKKTEYGIIALRHISLLQDKSVATVREISLQHKIPKSLLAKILQQLAKEDMISSVQGSHGGYVLKQTLKDISLAQVVEALDGPIKLTDCGDQNCYCKRIDYCDLRHSLKPIQERLLNYFQDVKLDDFLKVA